MTSSAFSSLWRSLPVDFNSKIETCIDDAVERTGSKGPVHVFFRADDVAVPGRQFARLMDLFTRHRAPLSLAVVPAWLSRTRWKSLKRLGQKAPSLWCWHQHGWRHANHEPAGKKQEFGPGRSLSGIHRDLGKGRRRLENLLGKDFYPIFTPPWNRCDFRTLDLLLKSGYRAVSRYRGSLPFSPDGLPDVFANVDLHTRKAMNPAGDWDRLYAEFDRSVASGLCGIMIHHRKMNNLSFTFVDTLLHLLRGRKDISLVHLGDMAEVLSK
ncbi:MAG: polysaccharide deacetylase family protein [Pseudomonadota bacterium]